MHAHRARTYVHHHEGTQYISASPEDVFAYVDDHKSFSSHMNKPSWMMGGGKMETTTDSGHGQIIGSHILLSGTAFGLTISLDEVVTHYEPPVRKIWETVGTPNLLVIGQYQMGIEIRPQNMGSLLRVFIDYDLPTTNVWLGRLFSGVYATWCVQQMLQGTRKEFISTKT